MANTDKRSVATDALETLGNIIDENQKRDAIHLAVEPVVAGEILYPGERIFLLDGKAYKWSRLTEGKALGIVDPFLNMRVEANERFWLVVMPRQITSLRHVWSHPDFAEAEVFAEPVKSEYQVMEVGPDLDPKMKEAVRFLRKYADDNHLDYGPMMLDAMKFAMNETSYCPVSSLDYVFWDNFEIVTGVELETSNDTDGTFYCSC